MTHLFQSSFKRPSFSPLLSNTGSETELEEISSLPDLIQFNAQHNPNHLFCIQAQTIHDGLDRLEVGSRAFDGCSITFKQLDDAVKSCANWLSNLIDSQDQIDNSELQRPVALYLESDVGLFFHLVALQILDIPVLLISARLSAPSVGHLLEKTKCGTVLVSKRTAAMLAGQINDDFGMKIVEPYMVFLRKTKKHTCGRRKQNKNADNNKIENCNSRTLILHSSGTTGFPKPIFLSKGYPLQYAACHEFAAHEEMDWINLSTLPLYHGFGFLAPCLSLSIGMTCCFPPSSIIPAGHSTLDLIETFSCRSLMTVPSIIDDLLAIDGAMDCLSTLKFLAVGGGALKPEQGVRLKEHHVRLLNHYGVTEIGALAPIFCPGPDYNWRYLRLRSDLNLELRPIPDSQRFKLVGWPLGWNEPFEVQDELERNADSSPNHVEVRIIGRTDDLIVLKTGEKVMPQHLESVLNVDPSIKTAVCIGQGFFEIVVLIELNEPVDGQTERHLVDHVWKLISVTNPSLDRHARVSSKNAIIVKPTHKAIPKTDKGSVSRRLAHEVFAQEIEAAYVAIEDDWGKNSLLELSDVKASIREMVKEVFATSEFVDASQDLFEQGMDSLQALKLGRLISSAIKRLKSSNSSTSTMEPSSKLKIVSTEFVYRNPSIERLAAAVQRHLTNSDHSADLTMGFYDHCTQMNGLVRNFITSINDYQPVARKSHVILLTGATGSLGSHVLDQLTRENCVSKVICLYRRGTTTGLQNGSVTALGRQKAALSAAGVVLEDECWAKIELVEDMEFLIHHDHGSKKGSLDGDIDDSEDKELVFSRLASQVTHIIHLAWPVDFQRTLESFTPHLQMVEALIRLARLAHAVRPPGARPRVRLLFSSSIAVVRHHQDWLNSSSTKNPSASIKTAVPESAMESPRTVAPMGYAEAKWICEHMLHHAGCKFREEIDPVVARIGQLSGPEHSAGVWKTGEHIPALVKASCMVGAFPQLEGTMSWLPVDRAARSLVEIMFYPGELDCFVHLENATRQPASDIMTIMAHNIGLEKTALMPFEEWLQRAHQLGAISSLIDFFQHHFRHLALGGVVLDTAKSRSVSKTLRGSSGLGKELLIQYLQLWKQEGLFG